MSNLIRKATLLAVGALLLAGAAYAGAPSSAQSTKPVGIQLVGTNGAFSANSADPRGNATYVIKDAVPNVVPNAQVTINFSGCPQIRLCGNQSAGLTVNCTAKTVTGTTDGTGTIIFSIVGTVDQATYVANQNFPEPDPVVPVPGNQNYFGCATVTVTVPGFPAAVYPNLIASAYDQEVVNPGVGSGDLSLCITDINSGNYRERSDYDVSVAAGGAGALNSGDLSQMIATANGGGSSSSCVAGQTGTPCVP
jgi:hypothetical protein